MISISEMSKIFTWVNSDMDGAISAILLGNIFPNMEYRHCFFGNFAEQYEKWEKEHSTEYEKIFVVGMVLDQNMMKKFDDPKVVFICDTEEKLRVYDSLLVMENTTSCCKLIYSKFKNKVDFSLELKKLILYGDDYNCQALKFTESSYLNAIYRSYTYDRFGSFVRRFWKGYDGFTSSELEQAETYFKSIEGEIERLEFFEGTYSGVSVLSTFSKFSVNEVAQNLLDNHAHDVIIVVNPDTKFVSFRKRRGSDADISKMAWDLCEGGGSEFAAGGILTKRFLDFTSTLIRI